MRQASWRVIWCFMRPYRWLYAAIVVVMLVASLLESVTLVAFFPVFQSLVGQADQAGPGPLAQGLHPFVARWSSPHPALTAVMWLVVIAIAKAGVMLLRERLIAEAGGHVMDTAKQQVVRRYVTVPYGWFLERKLGHLLYTALTAPLRVAVLLHKVPQLVAEALNLAAVGIVLLLAWPLAACVLGLVGLGYGGLTYLLGRRVSYHTGAGRAEAAAEQEALASELFSGIRQISVFGVAQAWLSRFRQVSRRYREFFIKDYFWLAVPRSLLEVTSVLLLAGLIAWHVAGGSAMSASHLPVLGVFGIALVRLLPSLTTFGRLRMELFAALPDAERVYQELTAPQPARAEGTRVFRGLQQAIQFEGVTFAHPGREAVLQDMRVTVERGQITALVGASGTGKSTLINLLLGLLEPTAGRILVDGVPLQEYRRTTWLAQIGFVSQDPFIVHATAADNIVFGRVGVTQEAVRQAAQVANAHEFITALPEGYDTLVGERGMKLSGGEQQRLAIARAILGDPDILIFDEATSHLDTLAERQVQAAIDEVSRDRTVLLVAHRLSTVRYADKIAVLEDGRIIEQGSHEQLCQDRGRYYQLVTAGETP